MNTNSATLENAISRRHFPLSASLATAAVGVLPLTGMKALVPESPAWADDPGKMCLWYDRPAKAWMTEALPIGNGPMGAMLFGRTEVERVQFWDDGHLAQAVIHSKSGLPCMVVYGDQSWEFNTTAGKSYPLTLASKVNSRSVR